MIRKTTILAVLSVFILAGFNAQAQLVKAVVAVTGNVMNSETKEPVSADIHIYDLNHNIVNKTKSNAARDGAYYIPSLQPGAAYFVEILKDGYFKERYRIDVPNSDKYVEISRDFLVRPLREDIKIKLKVPPFELHKSKLRYGADFLLKDIANTLKHNPEVDFKILCYPDNNKNKNENMELTQSRANSLKDYLVINGVDPTRIAVEGKAEVDPANPMPEEKAAKGKRYIGTSYIQVTNVE